ncbi:hypothetical protein HPB50_027409 [Hyalomma asiaticum]|uniref:Uncharacterized protein n=1 Tax=Hyalomma asiaticum TaxID=266040 RepID=A0ACB7T7P7_HYAAI|nr:hypothetical protein HPB50_027409 [Hyalomma asiaticum]
MATRRSNPATRTKREAESPWATLAGGARFSATITTRYAHHTDDSCRKITRPPCHAVTARHGQTMSQAPDCVFRRRHNETAMLVPSLAFSQRWFSSCRSV